MPQVLQVQTPIHGRVLVEPAATRPVGMLVGFHGYAETADVQFARLAAVPGADAWTRVSIQALHRFYRGRSEEVVASWMTRQDRDQAIADNLQYVNAAIDAVQATAASPALLVFAGFSQGVAMAFRAAARGRRRSHGVIAVGGGVPPELAADDSAHFTPTLLVRGARDDWYTEALMAADVAALERRGVRVRAVQFDGVHEWGADATGEAGRFLSAVQSF